MNMVEVLQKVDAGITSDGIIVGVVMYGICHGIWKIISWAEGHLESEAGHIIKYHIKAGHKTRFRRCEAEKCATVPETVASFQVTQHQKD